MQVTTDMEVAVRKRSLYEDPHCGDQCGYWQNDRTMSLCLADGLGHGIYAEEAANAAVDCVGYHITEPLLDIFDKCNQAIRHTRGVAMGIAMIDRESGRLSYAGIGNTRAMVIGQKNVRFTGYYGIVGSRYKKLSIEKAQLTPGDLIVLSSDGLDEMHDLSQYDKLLNGDVSHIAEQMLEDWSDGSDDASILVARYLGQKQ